MKQPVKGQPLLDLLQAKLHSDSITLAQLGELLGLSQSYISQLLSGDKPVSALQRDVIRRIAGFLDMPTVLCELLGGRLEASDFFSVRDKYAHALEYALQTVAASNSAMESAVRLDDLLALPDSVKLLLVLLYELAEHVVLLPGRLTRSQCETLSQLWVPFEVQFNTTR